MKSGSVLPSSASPHATSKTQARRLVTNGQETAEENKYDKAEVEDKNAISKGSPNHGESFVVCKEDEAIYPKGPKMYTIPSENGFIHAKEGVKAKVKELGNR